ncbi:hypothetical protein [Egbenema bharatensis]
MLEPRRSSLWFEQEHPQATPHPIQIPHNNDEHPGDTIISLLNP